LHYIKINRKIAQWGKALARSQFLSLLFHSAKQRHITKNAIKRERKKKQKARILIDTIYHFSHSNKNPGDFFQTFR